MFLAEVEQNFQVLYLGQKRHLIEGKWWNQSRPKCLT